MFIDGDLSESLRPAIESVQEHFTPDSMIFIDGIVPGKFADGIFTPKLPEGKGVADALAASGMQYTAQHTYMDHMACLQVVNEKAFLKPLLLLP